jgi:hypothetical protein
VGLERLVPDKLFDRLLGGDQQVWRLDLEVAPEVS